MNVVGVREGSDELRLKITRTDGGIFYSISGWIQLIRASLVVAQVVGGSAVAQRQLTKKDLAVSHAFFE